MADLFKYEEENLFKFEDGGDLFKYEDQPSQFKLDANQPVTGALKSFVPETQPLVRESNVLNSKPIEPTIKNSPGTIYRSDNPLLNSVLGIPRALESGALQTAQAVTGAMYDVDPNAARDRMRALDERQQALRLAAGGQADYEQGAGSMAALAPLVAMGPGAMSLGAGVLAGGPAYQQAREKDIGHLGSAAYAAGQGGLEYATERIPLGIMFGQGGKGVIERLVKAMMPEITSEQIATLTQDALQQAVLNPEKSWDEYWNERGQAAVQTLKATVGGMGAAGAIMQAQQMLTPEQTKGEQFAQALQNEVNTTDLGAQNASQIQGPSAGMLRQERPKVGLQENGGTYAQPQEATGEGQAQEGVTNTVKGDISNGLVSKADQEIMALLGDKNNVNVHADILRSIANEAGWAQQGGRLIRTYDETMGREEVTGRTKWIPFADWYAEIPANARMNREGTVSAVEKYLNGEKLTAKESRVVNAVIEVAQPYIDAANERKAIQYEGKTLEEINQDLNAEYGISQENMALLADAGVQGVMYSQDGSQVYTQNWMDNDVSGLAERVKRVAYVDDSYRLPNLKSAVPADMIPKQAKQATVTVYRGVPSSKGEAAIRPGDWVTLDSKYAKQHGTGETGKSTVIKMDVPAEDVAWAGTDMNEYFYAPKGLVNEGERAIDALNRLGPSAFGEKQVMPSIGSGKGMTTNEVITAITKKFGKKAGKLINEGRLRIVQSASDLPEWGRNQKGIGGAWDGKTAWIVADSMNPNKVIGAYLHEVGEHAGMRGIMGDNYQQLINRFNELLQEGDPIAVKADSRVPKDTRAGDVAQERIAYFIEEATKQQQANTISEKAIRLLKDIIAAIRAWAYRKFGGVKLNADDFVALAKHAANVWADTQAQEKVDSPLFSKEDVDELAKKFAFAIKGQADARIQSSAEKAFLDNQDMFERMKRGVVSVKDSEAAGDLLAKEVGWSPESIDQFIKDAGTQGVPPVEVLAATMAMSRMQSLKLLEAQDPAEFLEYTADVLNTLMATRAYGSEMGRALQFIGAMERKGGYTPEQAKAQVPTAKKQAKQTADKAFEILKDKSVSHEDMKKALGGDKGIKKIMEAIKAQGKDIDLGMLVQYLSGVADGIVQAQKEDTTKVNSLMNMAMELFQANILTGIFTHEVNITSNMANMLMEFAFIQPVKGLVGGKKGLAGTAEGYKMLGGYKQLLSDIWALMKYNAFEELPASRLSHLLAQRDPTMIALMRGSEGSKWNDTKRKYIPGKAGKIIRGYGFVPLGVEDAIFKVIPFRFELARQKGAGESQDIAKAIRFAEEMTFQSKSEFASTVARFTSKHPSTKPWLLFIKTMTNIMKRITELTPVAGQIYNKKELLGLEGKDAQQSAVARMIVGWSLAAMLWGLIDDGEDDGEIGIIGYGPSERRKEALWKKAGNEQVALRVGDDLYPFYRLDPVAGFIGLVAAEKKAATYAEGEKYDDAIVEIANGFYQAIMSKHFMVNVEETIGLMQDLIRYQKPQEEIEDEGKYKAPTPLDRVRRSMAKMGMSMVIPNIIPQIGDLTDEQKRKTRTIEDDLLRKFPVLREQLPEMLDVSGQPMEEPRYHSPYPINKKHAPRDEVSRWMMKLGRTLESDPVRLRGLDKDVRKELLQRRWDRVTLAYDISKDMPKDMQKDTLEKALGAWSRESGRIIMMEELNKE